jgi:hypothetical protein
MGIANIINAICIGKRNLQSIYEKHLMNKTIQINIKRLTKPSTISRGAKRQNIKTSKFTGVDRYKGKFRCRIYYKGRYHALGVYICELTAAKVYDDFIKKNHLTRPLNFRTSDSL